MIAYPLRIVTIRKLMMLALIVVADQADVNGYQKHENQGLYKTNQHFHKVKGNRQNPINLGVRGEACCEEDFRHRKHCQKGEMSRKPDGKGWKVFQ